MEQTCSQSRGPGGIYMQTLPFDSTNPMFFTTIIQRRR